MQPDLAGAWEQIKQIPVDKVIIYIAAVFRPYVLELAY
jgi:hypothetical protein